MRILKLSLMYAHLCSEVGQTSLVVAWGTAPDFSYVNLFNHLNVSALSCFFVVVN